MSTSNSLRASRNTGVKGGLQQDGFRVAGAQATGPMGNDDWEAALAFWTFFLLFLTLLASGPWWPYSRGWGVTPAAVVLVVLLGWLAVIWVGGVPFAWPWAASVPPPPDLPT